MPRVIDDPDRPTCPTCARRTWVKNRTDKVQRYECPQCNVTGTAEEFRENRLKRRGPYKKHAEQQPVDDLAFYDDPATEPDPQPEPDDCYACEVHPVSKNGLCTRCLAKLSRARYEARQLTADEKRARARAAAIAFVARGYVCMRPLAQRVADSHYLKYGRKTMVTR